MAEGEERPCGEGDDENGKYPIGFRFKPTAEELVEFYLLPKLLGEPTVPNEFVVEANTYGCDPEILTEKYKESGVDDDTWYFLSPRYRKYQRGDRPGRGTSDKRGRWKPATGQSKLPEPEVEEGASTSTSQSKAKKAAAFRENTLAYYVGPTTDETKTKWLMHELVVPEAPRNGGFHSRRKGAGAAEPSGGMLLNRYVVCRIYKSPLIKWKDIDEKPAAAAAAAEVPTSSQSSGTAPECVGEAAARASSSRQPPAKRPAVGRPATSGHTTGAPNKGVSVSQTTLFSGGGPSAPPTRGNGGGSSVRVPAGAGAGAAGHHGPGLPALVHWPPVYRSMQGPVQVQQPPLVYGYGNRAAGMPNANGRAAPGQGPPVYSSMQGLVQVQHPPLVYGYGNRAAGTPNANGQAAPGQGPPVRPPHRAAATAQPNSLGPPKTMTRPPNLAADQPAPMPSPRQQQQQPPPVTEEAYRVYAKLIAEMKLQRAQQEIVARAGQQRIAQTASAPPACSHDEAGDRPVGAEAMVPPAQFPAPHGGGSNNNLAQRPQRKQSSSAAPAPAAVEKAPAAENVPSKQSVAPGASANGGSGDGDAATVADNIILQILAGNWPL